jgi:hypothetical protein
MLSAVFTSGKADDDAVDDVPNVEESLLDDKE